MSRCLEWKAEQHEDTTSNPGSDLSVVIYIGIVEVNGFLQYKMKRRYLLAGLVVSALLGVGAKVPASMDAPVREVFHTPPGMSAPIEPLLLYQASQDEKCCHWVDSVYNRMNLREKVGQLFIYTIAPVQTKRNMQLLRDAVHTYKVGGLLFPAERYRIRLH